MCTMPPRMEGHIAKYHARKDELLTGDLREKPKVAQRDVHHYSYDFNEHDESERDQQQVIEELEHAA